MENVLNFTQAGLFISRFEKQRELLLKLDNQISESHKIQKDQKYQNNFLKNKVEGATKLANVTKIENTNLKVDLQVQKDLVIALKLKLGELEPQSVHNGVESEEVITVKDNATVFNDEGPLSENE